MLRRSKLLLALSFIPAAGLAHAADPAGHPPVITAESVMPDETSAGWYLRGDIGITRNMPPPMSWNGVSESDRSAAGAATGDVGIGYRFNDNFRTDLTLDFLASHRISGAYDATTRDHLDQTSFALMANGYYDLMKVSGITPYIGAGIGVARVDSGTATRDISGLATYTFGGSMRYALSAAAMAGFSIDIGHGLQADFGYRLAWVDRSRTGLESTGTLIGPIKVDDSLSHQFRVGLRYYVN